MPSIACDYEGCMWSGTAYTLCGSTMHLCVAHKQEMIELSSERVRRWPLGIRECMLRWSLGIPEEAEPEEAEPAPTQASTTDDCGEPAPAEQPQFNPSGSKYLREFSCCVGGRADVYTVLEAFAVTCPARQHAIKKLLCSGIRGKGDVLQDLMEARDAVDRAIQMQISRTIGKEDDC